MLVKQAEDRPPVSLSGPVLDYGVQQPDYVDLTYDTEEELKDVYLGYDTPETTDSFFR